MSQTMIVIITYFFLVNGQKEGQTMIFYFILSYMLPCIWWKMRPFPASVTTIRLCFCNFDNASYRKYLRFTWYLVVRTRKLRHVRYSNPPFSLHTLVTTSIYW